MRRRRERPRWVAGRPGRPGRSASSPARPSSRPRRRAGRRPRNTQRQPKTLRDPFGEHGPDEPGDHPRRRQHGEHPRPLGLGERSPDRHVADRRDHAGAEALDEAAGDEHGHRRRQPADDEARRRTAPARPTYGRPAPWRSAWSPAKTMPIIVPRKNAVVTQPYQAMPPRSASMSGRIVMTASDSNATSVTTDDQADLERARRPASGRRSARHRGNGTTSKRSRGQDPDRPSASDQPGRADPDGVAPACGRSPAGSRPLDEHAEPGGRAVTFADDGLVLRCVVPGLEVVGVLELEDDRAGPGRLTFDESCSACRRR